MARAGLVARGVLYGTIGLLATLAALTSNREGRTTGSEGALRELHQQPFGKALLIAVAAGLAGYALWRFVRAFVDPEHEGTTQKALLSRVGHVFNGIAHSALCVYAISLITGNASSGGEFPKSLSARLMGWAPPLGELTIGAIGLVLLVVAVGQLRCAWKTELDQQLELGSLKPGTARGIVQLSRFGIAARAVVFALMGSFLIVAAWQTDPNEAKGLGEALSALHQQPFGRLAMGLVALGLMAFGVYQFVEARYRRMPLADGKSGSFHWPVARAR